MIGWFRRIAVLGVLLLAGTTLAAPFVLPPGVSETSRKRLERFESFQIRGVCNDRDLQSLVGTGVNTVRGYSIRDPKVTLEKLDLARQLGLKLIISEAMNHQGTNKRKDGTTFEYDYHTSGDDLVARFAQKVEAIGDHPAILMWGLGNEVRLEEPYLRTVNRMSLAIHERYPNHLTSLTIVNAKQEKIELVKKFAPDIDVLGVQSYSIGAVRKAVKNAEEFWGKPFYMSEFSTNGPWHVPLSEWGLALDEPVSKKVSDLKECYEAIDSSPLCLGSTVFVWGHSTTYRPSYFSLLLDPNPDGPDPSRTSFAHMYRTPQAEVMIERFTGQPIVGNRAPVLTRLQFDNGKGERIARPGESMRIEFSAEDPDGDSIEFITWIQDSSVRPTKTVSGPFPQASSQHALVPAPMNPGQYILVVYAVDQKRGGSVTTLVVKVPEEAEEEK